MMRDMRGPSASPMRTFWRIDAVILFGCLSTSPAFADPGAERESLARLIHEIESLSPLIATAQSQASPDARIRFRYDWLRQDLGRIRRGIQDHIDAPRSEPRTVPPLRGDYRQ